MAIPTDSSSLARLVEKSLQGEIEKVVLEETEKAAEAARENVRKRVKEITIKASAAILQRFEMTTRSNELLIRVNFLEDER